MAATISTSISVTWTNGVDTIKAGTQLKVTQVGTKAIQNVQAIGATSEALVLGDVTGAKTIVLKSLETSIAAGGSGHTIYIDSANPATTSSAIHLAPGESHIMHTSTDAWYAIGSAGSSDLDVFAAQD